MCKTRLNFYFPGFKALFQVVFEKNAFLLNFFLISSFSESCDFSYLGTLYS